MPLLFQKLQFSLLLAISHTAQEAGKRGGGWWLKERMGLKLGHTEGVLLWDTFLR